MSKTFGLSVLYLLFSPIIQLLAQAKNDFVIQVNGERKEGKITGITNSLVNLGILVQFL